MMSLAQAKRRVTLCLTGARFLQFGPVEAGRLDHEDAEEIFLLGSYYAHRIDNQFLPVGPYRFILSNGFLASHAYNLALVLLVFRDDRAALSRAFRSNMKQFYADCCLDTKNCLIGRALLIEVLCYEQEDRRHIFERKTSEIEQIARRLSLIMGQLPNLHEMAHYFEHRAAAQWEELLRTLDDGRLAERFEVWRAGYPHPPDLATELCCDGIAALLSLADREDAIESDPLIRARMTAFGFLCIAELTSLQRCAQESAREADAEDQHIQPGSEMRTAGTFSFRIGRDALMDLRCAEMIALIEEEVSRQGRTLYGEDGTFPLPRDTADLLRAAFEQFMDTDLSHEAPAGTATTAAQRGTAQLIAESLHGWDIGAEHLLWRSKRFTIGSQPIDP